MNGSGETQDHEIIHPTTEGLGGNQEETEYGKLSSKDRKGVKMPQSTLKKSWKLK